MSEQDLEKLAKRVSRETLRETLFLLGVDIEDPKDVREFRADLIHARKVRRTVDAAGSRVGIVVLVLVVTGLAAALWNGVTDLLR